MLSCAWHTAGSVSVWRMCKWNKPGLKKRGPIKGAFEAGQPFGTGVDILVIEDFCVFLFAALSLFLFNEIPFIVLASLNYS